MAEEAREGAATVRAEEARVVVATGLPTSVDDAATRPCSAAGSCARCASAQRQSSSVELLRVLSGLLMLPPSSASAGPRLPLLLLEADVALASAA